MALTSSQCRSGLHGGRGACGPPQHHQRGLAIRQTPQALRKSPLAVGFHRQDLHEKR
jgi:hypothetical protein